MYTLGINAVYHDPAAVLVKDGQVIAAAEEERFTQIKHGKRPIPFTTYELPFNAMDYVLRQGGITITGVDHVAYSYDPWLLLGDVRREDATITLPLEPSASPNGRPVSGDFEAPWDPLFLSYIVNAPRQLVGGAPHHLKARFKGARPDGPYKWHFVEHHLAHAASAFLPSPFQEAAILTLDGRGELATTTYDIGGGNDIERLGQVNMPHSLGILYEQVTDYLGFLHSSDEYKVMALASFGKRGPGSGRPPNGDPKYLADFFEIITLGREGQFTVQPPHLEERFGPRRERGGPLEQRHYDIAYALQVALEETVLELVGWLYRTTGMKNLAMAGGVALNVVMNSCIRDSGPFEQIWVQPAAGDAGTALGAALWVDSQERVNGNGRRPYCMDHAFLGPEYSEQEIENYLRWSKLPYRRLNDVAGEVAGILAQDKIIGWFEGRHEFGPRALGARSILASPISPTMQARLNDIKDREDFRPVAPVVLEEEAPNWFMNGAGSPAGQSPFMLFVFDVRQEKAGMIPAVQHIDGTARIQTINRAQNAPYYDLLKAFGERTGVPILVNTSFHTRGKPIVLTPRDALETFWTSPLDALVMGPFILEKPGGDA